MYDIWIPSVSGAISCLLYSVVISGIFRYYPSAKGVGWTLNAMVAMANLPAIGAAALISRLVRGQANNGGYDARSAKLWTLQTEWTRLVVVCRPERQKRVMIFPKPGNRVEQQQRR